MQKLPAAIRSGQHVIVRDEPWLVVQADDFPDATLVTLRGAGDENLGETARVLAPFDAVHLGRTRTPLVRGARRAALEAAAAVISDSPRWDECRTAASARIDLRRWQLEPAVAAVNGASRLLLADGVGLGKTIQALLIVSELMARGLARRVLVLTPASLREQWAAEARSRFGLGATVFDQTALSLSACSLPAGINPWSTASLIVSSIDLVKRGEVRSALDAVPLDILVVDEAHHLTPASDRGAVVADLAMRTPWLVLLTATPHTGDEAAFRFLQTLGDVERSGGIPTFRRRPDEVRSNASRRQRLLTVATTAEERALLDETLAYARAVWSGVDRDPGAALVAGVIARRAASSAAAAQVTLERRLALLSQIAPCEAQSVLPWDEGDGDDDEKLDDAVLAAPGLKDRTEELAWLQRLARLAAAASLHSSKVAFIRRLLRRIGEPLIVFSEYRDVVRTVAARIGDLSTVAVLHGGLSAQERRHQLAAFTGGRARTLVTTDAAGEGLNLQAGCRLVVNLELPWNPLRLEQRIGRVDRLGQQRRVHALQLVHRRSFEELVLGRMEARWAQVTGSAAATEAFTSGDRELTSARDRRLRVLARGATTNWSMRSVIAESTCGGEGSRVTLVFATDLVDGRRRLVERNVTALHVDLLPDVLFRGVRVIDIVRRLTRDARIRAAIDPVLAADVDRTRSALARAADAYGRRCAGLLKAIAHTQGMQLFQTSLFDRREEQRSQLRAAAVAAWERNLERHLESAHAMRTISVCAPRLVAAWVE